MNDMLITAPRFSREAAEAMLLRHFGVKGRLTPLESERDLNFKVDGDGGGRYVFKIVNAAEPPAEGDFQTALLAHIAHTAPHLPVPRVLPATTGGYLAEEPGAGGQVHRLRLVEWVDGKPLAQSERKSCVLEDLGRTLALMAKATSGFMHAGALREIDWNLTHASRSKERLEAIDEPADRSLIERIIGNFEKRSEKRFLGLRSGVIHNDANDWNVLVSADGEKVSGLIDFGDAVYAPFVAELAIAAAYAAMDHSAPVDAVAAIVKGYHAINPLDDDEFDVLFDLVAMRLVTSVTISASRRQASMANPYLAVSESGAWDLLRKLDRIDPRFFTAIIRKACGLEAMAGARVTGDWISENARDFAPVLQRPAAFYPAALVPYGDPSHPMTVASASMRPEEAQAIWDAECMEGNIALGIGPFGEKRSVYQGDMFLSRFREETRRVRHLGLDLFMPAGTPVFTPVNAVVRSVEIEQEPLGYGCLISLEHRPTDGISFVTLWGHMAHEAMGRLQPGQKLEAGALVGHMGGPSENGGWAPHLHLQISVDPNLSATEILGVGEEAYMAVWADLFPDASKLAGIAPEFFTKTGRSREEIVSRRRELLLPNLSISYETPIKFVRGDGVWLIDDTGRAYLDCFNNVCHLGHAHPEVVGALAEQASRLNTNTRYLHDNIVNYAERLTALLPGELAVCGFVNSGSEANSLALRMMRARTGSEQVVVLDWAYHGTNQELIDISPYKFRRKGGQGQKAHVHVATVPDSYHAPEDWPLEEHGRRYAESVFQLIDKMKQSGERPGCFIAESVPSVAGQVFLPKGYLQEVYGAIREAGGICIADEVQVGFGRLGSHWWGFEDQDVTPDIVTLGKPIGNGHPMAAVVATREVASSFNTGMEYFNTFGGNPVSCAVGLAVLDVIERQRLRENADTIGNYIISGVRKLQEKHQAIGDVRGMGLFLGIELVKDRHSKAPATALARAIANGARARGVLLGTEGPHDNILKLRPPMIFQKRHADLLLEVLDDSIAAAIRQGS